MLKMSSLTVDGMVTAVYEAVQSQNAAIESNASTTQLVRAIGLKMELLSKSASQWLQRDSKVSLLRNSSILSALREMSLLLTLDKKETFAENDEIGFRASETFLADERRGECGEVRFLRLTLELYTAKKPTGDNKQLCEIANTAFAAVQTYLQRSSAQCVPDE